MTRFFFLPAITLVAFLPARLAGEPPRLPDAKNGTDPKVIHLLVDNKDAGTLAVINKTEVTDPATLATVTKTEVLIYLVENRGQLKFQQSVNLNKAMKCEWRVSGQMNSTEGGGALAVNQKGEVYLDSQVGSSWEYEFPNGEKTSERTRIKCTDPGLKQRYLKVSDKTEDYQFGIAPDVTVKVRRLYLVESDGDWFRFVGGNR